MEKDVLVRLLTVQISAGVIGNVVAAGENQQRTAIRTDGCAHGLPNRKLGRAGQVRIQAGKASAACRSRSNAHAGRQIGGLGVARVVFIWRAARRDLKEGALSGHKQEQTARNEAAPNSHVSFSHVRPYRWNSLAKAPDFTR